MGDERDSWRFCKPFHEQDGLHGQKGMHFMGIFKIKMFYSMNIFLPVLFRNFNPGLMLWRNKHERPVAKDLDDTLWFYLEREGVAIYIISSLKYTAIN